MQQRLAVLRRPLRDQRRLVGAVSAAFDQPEIADVARQRRLRHVEAGGAHAAPQLLLTAHRRAVNDFDDRRLTTGLHRSLSAYRKCLTDYASTCINILFPDVTRTMPIA